MKLSYFLINGLGDPFACHMGHIGLRSPMALAPSLNMPLVVFFFEPTMTPTLTIDVQKVGNIRVSTI